MSLHISQLPQEIHLLIFKHLDMPDLLSVGSTGKSAYSLVQHYIVDKILSIMNAREVFFVPASMCQLGKRKRSYPDDESCNPVERFNTWRFKGILKEFPKSAKKLALDLVCEINVDRGDTENGPCTKGEIRGVWIRQRDLME